MQKTHDSGKAKTPLYIMDTLLSLLAGSAMVIISVSFLLWLRF